MHVSRRTFSIGALALGAAAPRSGRRSAEPVVETRYGKVSGVHNDGVYAFKGIPYGATTQGEGRFKPPVAPHPWSGVADCTSWGAMAPQGQSTANPSSGMGADMGKLFGTAPGTQTALSEDCLVLNVFTPGLRDGVKRPVMVWVHGGGFSIGTSAGPRTDGSNLARRQDVVSVSVNHRLGALGYAYLGGIDADFAHSGNQAQLDLILALQWVRDNIEAFGGDPNRVMIHGESGGGGKIGTLLGMPGAKGLFHRAALQSGVANKMPDRDAASIWAEEWMKEVGVGRGDLRKLQQMPFAQLIAAQSKMEFKAMRAGGGMRQGFLPTVGTAELPLNPIDAVSAGQANIPIIIGSTKHEMALMLMGAGMDPRKVTNELLEARFRKTAPELLDGYRAIHPEYTPGDLLVRAMTDGWRKDMIGLAEVHAKAGGPTWMYLFQWESPVLPYLHASHGIDGGFYFDNTETLPITQGNPFAKAIAARASAAWARFARTGAPGADWPQYDAAKRATMVWDTKPHVENDPLSADRKLRERIPDPA